MLRDTRQRIPGWIWGLALGLGLILLSTRGRFIANETALQRQFAAQPAAAGITLPRLDMGDLAPNIQRLADEAQHIMRRGQPVAALTPVAQNQRVRVEVLHIRRGAAGVQIQGQVTNVGPAVVTVPIHAFELKDNTGTSYTSADTASVQLGPGESTSLDLTVPLPEGRGLRLTVNLPPDPPLEQVLLVATDIN